MKSKISRKEFIKQGSKVAVGAGLVVGAINTGLLTNAAIDEKEVNDK